MYMPTVLKIIDFSSLIGCCYRLRVIVNNTMMLLCCFKQGSHASWKILESPEFFFFKIPGPGKSWKITLVLESPGKISLKITRH